MATRAVSIVLHEWKLKNVGEVMIVGVKDAESPRLESWLFLYETSERSRRRSIRKTLENKLQDIQLRLLVDQGIYYNYAIFAMTI
jgi:hypothetical protein